VASEARKALRAYALRVLARRDHGRAELAAKLRARLQRTAAPRAFDAAPAVDDAQAEIECVLDDLEQRGLVSDARAAEALLHAKAPRYGTRRLRQALQARALPADLVEQAVRDARTSEWSRACAIWRRRFGTAPGDAREHARQLRFLLARGFEADLARRVIREGGGSDDAQGGLP
jgi:regulatory protein